MKNLAGNPECDTHIRRELERARIDIVEGERSAGEVAASVRGRIGSLVLWRAWYYWVVKGDVPIAMARELYSDPVGKTDVRVDGHCGCPAPEHPWTRWLLPDGRQVVSAEQEADFDRVAMDKSGYVFSDAPYIIGARQFVSVYHIDTEVGLRLFADMARKHGLA